MDQNGLRFPCSDGFPALATYPFLGKQSRHRDDENFSEQRAFDEVFVEFSGTSDMVRPKELRRRGDVIADLIGRFAFDTGVELSDQSIRLESRILVVRNIAIVGTWELGKVMRR